MFNGTSILIRLIGTCLHYSIDLCGGLGQDLGTGSYYASCELTLGRCFTCCFSFEKIRVQQYMDVYGRHPQISKHEYIIRICLNTCISWKAGVETVMFFYQFC